MTVVIVSVFLLCGLPYHILELLLNFWSEDLPPVVTAIMGALPVANSVINPYIFLLFNMNYICVKRLVRPNTKRQYLEKTEQTTNMCSDTAVTVVKYTDNNGNLMA